MAAVKRANRLIVTADDFGLATEVNQAVEAAHRDGILSAASLMIAGPAAADAIARAHALPHLRVGLHLVLVDGHPALPPSEIPDLVDERGRLRSDMARLGFEIATRPAVAQQVSAEIAAQFEFFRAAGLKLDHVNAHKHFHLHPIIAGKVIVIGKRYGMRALRVPLEPTSVLRRVEPQRAAFPTWLLPVWGQFLRARAQRAGILTSDAVFGLRWSGAMTAKRLTGLIGNLPPGIIEIYTHPAGSDAFPGHAAGYRYREELAALRHPSCIEALRRSGYPLGGYSDIAAIVTNRLSASQEAKRHCKP